MKRVFYTEISYIIGLVSVALSAAFMEASDFGVSMVVAPAYIIYLKLSQIFDFFTFGMSEYMLQALILVALTVIMRKFRWHYLFSFVTAVLYGFILDGAMAVIAVFNTGQVIVRILFYLIGILFCSAGVALIFETYIPPEAYELLVKEVSRKFGIDINKFKTGYDCVSCILSVILSFVFFGFGHFEGVKVGTIIFALVNGRLIGMWSRFFKKHWKFKDAFNLRRRLET